MKSTTSTTVSAGMDTGTVESGREDLEAERTTEERRHDTIRLLFPEYGPVEGLVGVGLFYLIMERLTPVLVTELAGPFPTLVPDPLTTVTALLLWLVAGATVLAVGLTQAKHNPRTFEDSGERDAFLDANRPTEREYRYNLVLMVLGGATAVLAWDTFVEILTSTPPVIVGLGGELPSSLTVWNVAVLVVFVVGFTAYARGVDRLVVGGMREFLYRHFTGQWE